MEIRTFLVKKKDGTVWYYRKTAEGDLKVMSVRFGFAVGVSSFE